MCIIQVVNKVNMNQYNFKKFDNVKGKFETRISIRNSFSFGLPTKFYEDNNIAEYKYVVLYYDTSKKAIAFNFTNEKEDNSLSVTHHKEYGGGISARSFFRTYNLNPKDYSGKYEWEKDYIDGVGKVFIIDLRNKE